MMLSDKSLSNGTAHMFHADHQVYTSHNVSELALSGMVDKLARLAAGDQEDVCLEMKKWGCQGSGVSGTPLNCFDSDHQVD